MKAKIKLFFQIHVGNWPKRKNGKSSGFGNYFLLFKIASRKPCWVSVTRRKGVACYIENKISHNIKPN